MSLGRYKRCPGSDHLLQFSRKPKTGARRGETSALGPFHLWVCFESIPCMPNCIILFFLNGLLRSQVFDHLIRVP